MYILFEGIDGCGKSTQIELLKSHLNAVVTKEPGGTKLGVKLREILLHSDVESKEAELLLFLADRAEHFKEVIEPNLDKYILSDRGFISGIAYAMSSGFNMNFLIELNSFALNGVMPQKIVLFTITKEEAIKRVQTRGELDKIESRGFDYLMQIQDNMLKVVEHLEIETLVVDASKSIDEINKEIINFIGE